jgi:hypothetical protein
MTLKKLLWHKRQYTGIALGTEEEQQRISTRIACVPVKVLTGASQ